MRVDPASRAGYRSAFMGCPDRHPIRDVGRSPSVLVARLDRHAVRSSNGALFHSDINVRFPPSCGSDQSQASLRATDLVRAVPVASLVSCQSGSITMGGLHQSSGDVPQSAWCSLSCEIQCWPLASGVIVCSPATNSPSGVSSRWLNMMVVPSGDQVGL